MPRNVDVLGISVVYRDPGARQFADLDIANPQERADHYVDEGHDGLDALLFCRNTPAGVSLHMASLPKPVEEADLQLYHVGFLPHLWLFSLDA